MMKKRIALMLAMICFAGMVLPASAEPGFETLYELFCTEEVFGEPVAVYDYEPQEVETEETAEDVAVCFTVFLFDTEYDMSTIILIGNNAENEEKYIQWTSDYEPGATIMTFLVSQFAELKAMCDRNVDLCISFSFDGGENMTDIATVEDAEAFTASLQQAAGNQ